MRRPVLAFLRLVKRTKKTKRKGLLLFLTFAFCFSIFPNPVLAQQQNDAGTGGDAGEYPRYAVEIYPGTYSGLIDEHGEFGDGGDYRDCYKFWVEAGSSIKISATITDASNDDDVVYIDLGPSTSYGFRTEKSLWLAGGSWLFPKSGEMIYTVKESGYWIIEFWLNPFLDWASYNFTLSLEEVDFTLTATPSSGSVPPGGSATATIAVSTSGSWASDDAILLSASGVPDDASITFSDSIISPARGESSSTLTISIPSTTPLGEYSITITGSGIGKTHTKTWILNVGAATALSISPSSFTLDTFESITLTATLTSNGEPLSGKTITWYTTVGSISAASGTTNSSGQTSITYTAPSTAGNVTITASFAGDTQYATSNGNTIGTVMAIPEETQPLEPAFPWWAILLVALGSIVGLAAYLKRRRSRPGRRV